MCAESIRRLQSCLAFFQGSVVGALSVSIIVLSAGMAGTAIAQQYRWVDQDGKVRYGDAPPAGVKTKRIGNRTSSSPTENSAVTGKAVAPAAPGKAPVDEEMAHRLRQKADEAKRERQAQQVSEESMSHKACAHAKDVLKTLERPGARAEAGTRSVQDAGLIAQEKINARSRVAQSCN